MLLKNRLLLALATAVLFIGLFSWLDRRSDGPRTSSADQTAAQVARVARDDQTTPADPAARRSPGKRVRPPTFAPPPSLTHRPRDSRTIGPGETLTREALLATGVPDPELVRRSDNFVKLWREQHPDMVVVETRCYGEGCVSELEFDSADAFGDFVSEFGKSNAARSWEGQFSFTTPTLAATGKMRSAWYLFKSNDFIESARKQAQAL